MSAADIPVLHPLSRWASMLKLPENQLRKWADLGWFTPTVQSGKIKLYSADDIDQALGHWQAERQAEIRDIQARVRAVIGDYYRQPTGEVEP